MRANGEITLVTHQLVGWVEAWRNPTFTGLFWVSFQCLRAATRTTQPTQFFFARVKKRVLHSRINTLNFM